MKEGRKSVGTWIDRSYHPSRCRCHATTGLTPSRTVIALARDTMRIISTQGRENDHPTYSEGLEWNKHTALRRTLFKCHPLKAIAIRSTGIRRCQPYECHTGRGKRERKFRNPCHFVPVHALLLDFMLSTRLEDIVQTAAFPDREVQVL